MRTPSLHPVDDALAHADWVRRLARSLVRDDEVDDLTQDAWEAALRSDQSRNPGWLAGVLRNLAAFRHRSALRRRARDAQSEAPQPAPHPEEVVERLQLQRDLSALVAELPEETRVVLYLRFFEDLDATRVGERLGIPPGTVRWRLKQGLDALRASLDARHGDRAQWAALFVRLAPPAPSSLSLAPGVLIMKIKGLVLTALAVLLLVLTWSWLGPASNASGTTPSTQTPIAAPSGAIEPAGTRPEPSVAQLIPAWSAQPGAPSRRVAGRVLLGSTPAAKAVVTLSLFPQPTDAASQQRLTDAEGRFDFGAQPAVGAAIGAFVAGHPATVVELELRNPNATPRADALELIIREGCEHQVVGRVLDSGAGPVVTATVRLKRASGVRVNERGEYALCVPEGPGVIFVEAPGYGGVQLSETYSGKTVRDVVLMPEATVDGVVVEGATGAPVAEALVYADPLVFQRTETQPSVVGKTNIDGRFHLTLAPGDYKLAAEAGATARSSVHIVSALVGRANTPVTLELRSGVVLRGVVRSAGRPVAGAHVTVLSVASGRGADGYSQADGRFVISGLVPGPVAFIAAPWKVLRPTRWVAKADGPEVELEVAPLAAVHGLVTRKGAPVPEAEVVLSSGLGEQRATADAKGRYRIEGVAPGQYHVVATSNAVGAFAETAPFEITDDADREQNVELASAATISGVVVDETGRPLTGVLVLYVNEVFDEGRDVTDSEGRFRATQMTGGGIYKPFVFLSGQRGVRANAVTGKLPAVELADGNSEVTGVRLQVKNERLSLSGRVVDPNGNPIADVKLRAKALGPPGDEDVEFRAWDVLPQANTDGQGQFSIAGLTSGSWVIQARSPEGAQQQVTATAGQQNVVITLHAPARIEGTLVGFRDDPVIYARQTSQGLIAGQVTGATFTLSLPAGTWTISAMNNLEGEVQRVTVTDGEVKPLTMTSHGRGVLKGRVIDHATKAPVPNVVCHPVVASGQTPGVTNWDETIAPHTDADGRFEQDPAPAGHVFVGCGGDFQRMSQASGFVDLQAGQTAEVKLEVVFRAPGIPGQSGLELEAGANSIRSIQPGSAAHKVALAVGDVITSVDGDPVTGLDSSGVETLISNHPPGTTAQLVVQRGTTTRSVTLTLGR